MSGHSKWSTIKHGKAISDAKRGKLFTKLAREIIAAAKQGGGDPNANFRLRMAMQKAKDNNMPAENVERAISRALGNSDSGDAMSEYTYEGYGPGGVGILLETLTDNRNRTVADIRSTFSKAGGNMAESGAVAWQFDQKGVIVVEVAHDQAEELALVAIDAGAEDFETYDSAIHIYTRPDKLEDLRITMHNKQGDIASSEVSMIPNNTIPLQNKEAIQALRLLDQLEELEDVQRVFSNADFPDEVLDIYRQD